MPCKEIQTTDLLTSLPFLTPQGNEKIASLMPGIQNCIAKQKQGTTDVEIEFSLLNDYAHPTKASKYWQLNLEEMVRATQLAELSYKFRKLQNDLDKKALEIEDLENRILQFNKKTFINRVKWIFINKSYKNKQFNLLMDRLVIDKEELVYKMTNEARTGNSHVAEIERYETFKEKFNDGSFDTENYPTNELHRHTTYYCFRMESLMANPEGTTVGARNNIEGQFRKAVELSIENGVIVQVLKENPECRDVLSRMNYLNTILNKYPDLCQEFIAKNYIKPKPEQNSPK